MKIKSLAFISAIILLALTLTACQESSVSPSKNQPGDRKTPVVATKPDEEILPTLQLKENNQDSKIVLRSQTSHFLNSQKSALEIDVTSSKIAFCENQHPELKDKEEELIITLKSKDGKTALTKGEYANNKDFEITASRRNAAGQTTIPVESFQSLKITDLNNAIVRGNLNITSPALSISGEYFTAICK